MADNTTLNSGSGGDVIGSDDIGGIKFQRVKLIYGADGVNAGDVATGNGLPTLDANSAAIKTAVEIIDNAISGSEMQVDVVASLPSGTNTIGSVKLTDGTDTVDIVQLGTAITNTDKGVVTNTVIHGLNTGGGGSYVDVKVKPSGQLSTSIGDVTDIVGQQSALNSIPVVIASDQTVIPISDNSSSLTVDNNGTFAVQAAISSGTNYMGKVRLTDGTTDAEVIPLTNYNAQAVAIVDASGNQITSFGSPATPLFKGSTASFRTLGRAGTAGQKIAAIHNATGSSIKVKVRRVRVDMWATVVKAVTVAPPIVRLWKFTAVPTNGTVLTKNKIGGSTTSSASCTLWGDASADGTGSATTLTVTLPAGTIIDQRAAPRIITAVGEVSVAQVEFDYPDYIELAALEGLCVFLDYTLATQNPVTDMWVTTISWEEVS